MVYVVRLGTFEYSKFLAVSAGPARSFRDGEHIVLVILHSPEAIGSRSLELECCRWKSREKLTAQNGGSAVNTVLKEAIQGKDVSQSSTPRLMFATTTISPSLPGHSEAILGPSLLHFEDARERGD